MAVNDFKQYEVRVYASGPKVKLSSKEKKQDEILCTDDIIEPIVVAISEMLLNKSEILITIDCDIKRRITTDVWISRIRKYISSNQSVIYKQLKEHKVKVKEDFDVDSLCDCFFDKSVNADIETEGTKKTLQITIPFTKDTVKKLKRIVV